MLCFNSYTCAFFSMLLRIHGILRDWVETDKIVIDVFCCISQGMGCD